MSMMARSKRSNQRPDTLMQDRHRQIDELSCDARPDHTLGHKQTSTDCCGALAFDTPQHYTAEVRTQMTMAGQTMQSRLKIEGERVGECP
jgi:hypothetical protein